MEPRRLRRGRRRRSRRPATQATARRGPRRSCPTLDARLADRRRRPRASSPRPGRDVPEAELGRAPGRRSPPTASRRSSTPPAPPAGPRAASSPTRNLLGTGRSAARVLPELFDGTGSDAAVPAAGARLRPARSRSPASRPAPGWATPPTSRTCCPTSATFQPTFLLSVPRVFEKVYNTRQAEGPRRRQGHDLRPRRGASRSPTPRRSTRAAPGSALRLQHAAVRQARLRQAARGDGRPGRRTPSPAARRSAPGSATSSAASASRSSRATASPRPRAAEHRQPAGRHQDRHGRHAARPASTVRIADDGEILRPGDHVFRGYWHNETATGEVLRDGWFHTGDLGELDDDGFLRITGRKKEIIVTAGGKNVAPAVLEDRLRAHPLVSQCMVVGDQKPFIACLVTLDPEALPAWAERHGQGRRRPPPTSPTTPTCSPRCRRPSTRPTRRSPRPRRSASSSILPSDWTEEGGQITPSLKLKRTVVMKQLRRATSSALYAGARARSRAARERSARAAVRRSLVAQGLVVDFGAVRAVDGFDLSVGAGASVALVGRNGAGKSTTHAGAGRRAAADRRHGRRRRASTPRATPRACARAVGYCPDVGGLIPRATPVGAPAARRPAARHARLGGPGPGPARALRPRRGRRPRHRRLLATAWAGGCRWCSRRSTSRALLLLDEPFDGVDPLGVDATLRGRRARPAPAARRCSSAPTCSSSRSQACEEAVVLRGGRVVGAAPAAELAGARGRAALPRAHRVTRRRGPARASCARCSALRWQMARAPGAARSAIVLAGAAARAGCSALALRSGAGLDAATLGDRRRARAGGLPRLRRARRRRAADRRRRATSVVPARPARRATRSARSTQFLGGLLLAPLNLVWVVPAARPGRADGLPDARRQPAARRCSRPRRTSSCVTVLGQAARLAGRRRCGRPAAAAGSSAPPALGAARRPCSVVRAGQRRRRAGREPDRDRRRRRRSPAATAHLGRWVARHRRPCSLAAVVLAARRRRAPARWALRRARRRRRAGAPSPVRRRAARNERRAARAGRRRPRQRLAGPGAAPRRPRARRAAGPARRRRGRALVVAGRAARAGRRGRRRCCSASTPSASTARARVWLASLPHDPRLAAARQGASCSPRRCSAAVVLAAVAGSLRSPAPPTAAELTALAVVGRACARAVVVVLSLHVSCTARTAPTCADRATRSPRPARWRWPACGWPCRPPSSGCCSAPRAGDRRWWLPPALALPVLAAVRAVRDPDRPRLWRDPVHRALVVHTVAAG